MRKVSPFDNEISPVLNGKQDKLDYSGKEMGKQVVLEVASMLQ